MDFTKLLGKRLKDDAIMEILESNKLETIYDFDRLHENIDDIYWVQAKEQGFLLRFDKKQILDTIFLYIVGDEGFKPIEPTIVDVEIYRTFDDAQADFEKNNVSFQKSDGEPGSPKSKWWIKSEFAKYFTHYQYREGTISLITIMKKEK